MERRSVELDDEALRSHFAAANTELDGEAFVASVLRRSQRRPLIRDAVLGTTVAVAAALALGPLLGLADGLVAYVSEWHDPAWYRENALLVGAGLAMAVWPLVARWLAR